MTRPTLQILTAAFKRFNGDKCWTSAIVVSYFALLCAVPLIALFFATAARFLGDTEMALRSLNLFTDEFFARLDPGFFKSLGDLSGAVAELGFFGVVGSLVSASFLFSSLISAINQIFRTKYHKSFFYNRLMEYLIMFVAASSCSSRWPSPPSGRPSAGPSRRASSSGPTQPRGLRRINTSSCSTHPLCA